MARSLYLSEYEQTPVFFVNVNFEEVRLVVSFECDCGPSNEMSHVDGRYVYVHDDCIEICFLA